MPQVDAVERAERDHPRRRSSCSTPLDDLHSSSTTTTGRGCSPRGPAAHSRPSPGSAAGPPRRGSRSRGRAAARRARRARARAPAGARAHRCSACARLRRAVGGDVVQRARARDVADARSRAGAARRSRRRSRAPRRDRVPARARRCPSSSGCRARRGRSRGRIRGLERVHLHVARWHVDRHAGACERVRALAADLDRGRRRRHLRDRAGELRAGARERSASGNGPSPGSSVPSGSPVSERTPSCTTTR